ncbi:sugar ABC transporter substrate-binding protein [uncultured Agathobaculum sp.]|uniref:sugar ABC transporter substrate-binding protein n=1 Tax=uncultured Agathobaculum sp. TaxID=2048140 RepID=UPI00296F68D8
MKKRLLAALLTGALALSLTACGGGDSTPAQTDGDSAGAASHDGPYKISMVLKTNAAEFWNIVQAGAEAYEKEHPDQVDLDIKGPPAETYYEEQLNTIQTDLALESYDGYLIAPLQSEAVATAIASTDKPVVAYDTRIDSDKCLAFVGTGNKEAAKEGGKAAVEAAKAAGWTEIKCIEIAGVQGDATNTARMEGYREGVNEAGGEFLDNETQYANATADLAVTAMEGIMSKYPEGVAIICSNNDDMALAAARTAKGNPAYANTIFLGFDGQKSAVEAVASGELTMTAAQNNFDIGYKAVETIVKILNGEDYGDVDTGTEIITKDNASERLQKFDEWLK